MRTYDDPVEVRKRDEDPDQFLWRGKLWQVRAVVAHWVETGSWWLQQPSDGLVGPDLLGERDIWRVEAARGRAAALVKDHPVAEQDLGYGVFDLAFDWSTGDWRLAGAVD